MGFRRKSNDLFESVSQEFTLLIYVLSCRNCHLYLTAKETHIFNIHFNTRNPYQILP